MVDWQVIGAYAEPDWDGTDATIAPSLFWRPRGGATLGFIRDGELFDAKWIYVSDATRVTHFAPVSGPDGAA